MAGNSADQAGGAYYGTLNNCTLNGNSANYAGGALGSTLDNCVVYYNTAPTGANSDTDLAYGSLLNYCCTTPLPTNGMGNFTNEPMLLDLAGGDCHLQTNSPCINCRAQRLRPRWWTWTATRASSGGTVDIGAYEFQSPASDISYAWLQTYGLPTDGTADWLDTDHDGMNNYQEWLAGTDPTDATSVLRLQAPVINPPGLSLRWSSDTNHAYFVQRATGLKTPLSFSLLRSNIPGLAGATAYTDATASSPRRVRPSTASAPAPPTARRPRSCNSRCLFPPA